MFLFLETKRKAEVTLSKSVMQVYNLKLKAKFNPESGELCFRDISQADLEKVLRAIVPVLSITSMTMSIVDKELETLIDALDNTGNISELHFLPNIDKVLEEIPDDAISEENVPNSVAEAFVRVLSDEPSGDNLTSEALGMYMKVALDSTEVSESSEAEEPEVVAETEVTQTEESEAPEVEEAEVTEAVEPQVPEAKEAEEVEAIETKESEIPNVEETPAEPVFISFGESVETTFASGFEFYRKKYVDAGKLPPHQDMVRDFIQLIDFPTSNFASLAFIVALKIEDHKLSYDKIANELHQRHHYATKLSANTLKSDFKKWIRSNPSLKAGVGSSFPALLRVFRKFVKEVEEMFTKENDD